MSQIIRRISVGPDYKDAMHYQVGKYVAGGKLLIDQIVKVKNGGYDIYVLKDGSNEVYCWKHVNGYVPVNVENNIDF